MFPEKKIVLDLSVSIASSKDILEAIESSLSSDGKQQVTIAYANAYCAVAAHKDQQLASILNSVEILHPDGIGVSGALRFLYGEKISDGRINGTDLYYEILRMAGQHQWKIFLFGDTAETLNQAHIEIHRRYPGVHLVGSHHGFTDLDEPGPLKEIRASSPDILLLGLGMLRQELWIQKYRNELQVPVCIMVGGGISFLSGVRKRAPLILRSVGLEWLYRLFQEPQRLWHRYLIGIPLFCWLVLRQKLRS
jgi:N-acetylglucosaminyldiphosphoundecaprenol N-acetyl-beta-D-mannosaminyltransferase